MSDRKRLLTDLRVIDLRAELEKRNLDKSGVRGVLIQRLSKHLEDEGHDPATFKFELSTGELKTPSKRSRRSESAVEQDSEDTPAMEDMIVQDDAGDEDTEHTDAKQEASQNSDAMDVERVEKINRKRDIQDDTEATQAKKTCPNKEQKNEEDNKQENNTDAEDSINLDIGEDDLLNEETDNTTKSIKKDEAMDDEAATSSNHPEPSDDAPATDSAPADDQHQVNTEAPATRLVNTDRPSPRRPNATINLRFFRHSIFHLRYHYKVLHQSVMNSSFDSSGITLGFVLHVAHCLPSHLCGLHGLQFDNGIK